MKNIQYLKCSTVQEFEGKLCWCYFKSYFYVEKILLVCPILNRQIDTAFITIYSLSKPKPFRYFSGISVQETFSPKQASYFQTQIYRSNCIINSVWSNKVKGRNSNCACFERNFFFSTSSVKCQSLNIFSLFVCFKLIKLIAVQWRFCDRHNLLRIKWIFANYLIVTFG